MKGKLFLSGGGNEKQTYLLDDIMLSGTKNILYIPIAWKNEYFDNCLKWFKKAMHQHKKVEINMLIDLNTDINIDGFDVVYIGGGNTFKLLKRIKDSKFDKKLVDYFNNGGIIYGGSAGAIIFGNDINIALICKDADKNEVGLKDTRGLNLIKNFDIQCHFQNDQIKKHKIYLSKTGRDIICIPEESALLYEKEEYKVIGLKPITLITKRGIKKYSVGEVIK